MRVPTWVRWLLAAVLVVGIATAGVAANLSVLGSETDDTRLGTLSARSLAVASGQAPPVRVVTDDDDERDEKDEKDDDHDGDRRDDDSDDD